jgi:hypothetical protein
MPTAAFQNLTGKLNGFLSGQSFTLDAGKVDFSDALAALLELLLGEALSLTGASIKSTDGNPATWTVSGTPGSWPLPGINIAAGATVSLTITDGAQLDYQISAQASLAGSPLTATFSIDPGQKSSAAKLALAVSKPLSIGQLVDALTVPGLLDAVSVADDLLSIADAAFVSASVSLQKDVGKTPSVKGGQVAGILTLGSLAVQLMIGLPGNSKTPPTIALEWPPTGKSASCSLSELLSALHLPFTLPGVLDVTVTSLAIDYQPIAAASQLNPNDTMRVALRSPKDGPKPSLEVVWSRGGDKAWRMVARTGWNQLDLSSLPIVGAHLPARIDPLLLVIVTRQLAIADLRVLAGLADYPGLEDFGISPDKVTAETPVPAGIYCAAIFDVTIAGQHLVHEPAQIPLYKFGTQQKSLLRASAEASGELAQARQTTSLPLQKSVGPVHLDSVGFRYEDGTIAILLNISIDTGGLGLELVGLRLGYDVATHEFSVGIDGLLLSVDEGSVDISGALVRDTANGQTDWAGAAIVKVGDTFALEAVGAFSEGDPKSMFLFAYDHQQLGGPPWLIITGIAAGFGYNRAFIVPSVDEVDSFPFVAIANDLARGNAPNGGNKIDTKALWALMDSIKTSLGPADGSDFLTVGLTATSFGLVNTTALLTIVFGDSTEIVILGSSSISVPSDSPVAHAEVELVVSVQPDAGIIAIDGLLAPGSYVLSQACHLTGGFAYHLWFAGGHAGDFVLTFGGYGPNYSKPSHYPDVPRLAFIWKVSDELTVTGWNYFALTPSSVQAGGGLSIVLDADPLYVWCNLQADFFLGWLPFFYRIDVSVDFGVSFRLHVLFCTISISVDISADLTIWGPDFSGHAEVHLWFVSFGVDFGADSPDHAPAVEWDAFIASLVVPAPTPQTTNLTRLSADAALADPPPPLPQQPVQVVTVSGLTKSTEPGIDWSADPARTALTIVTTLPATTVTYNKSALPNAPTVAVHARPVDGSPEISPTLTICITAQSGDAENLVAWTPALVVEQVASALWGDNSAAELIPAVTGLRLTATAEKPDELGPVEQSILLVSNDSPTILLTWQKPIIPPQQSFSWDDNGPFKTMQAATIRSQLAGMVQSGYLDQSALDAIDLTFVDAAEPCFMAHPTLARLGAEQYSEAA